MNWEEYVQNFAQNEDPDYKSISFLFPDIERKQPSFFTRLNSHLLSEFALFEQKKAIIIYPTSDDFVLSVVFFQLIEEVLSGNVTKKGSNAADLKPGDKFKIGEAVVQCDRQQITDGVKYIFFNTRKGKNSHNTTGLPVDKLPPVEVAPATAGLSSEKDFWAEYHRLFSNGVFQEKALTLADRIKKGRIEQNGAVLIVSRNEHFTQAILDFEVEGRKVTDLISIHKAKFDGTLMPMGKSAYAPQIIIVPTIPAAYEVAIKSGNKILGIYIDTGSIKSIVEFEGDILGLTDEVDAPLYFFVPESSSLDYTLLLDRGFEVFRWTPGMVGDFIISNSDKSCHPFLNAVNKHTILPYCVANTALSGAFAELKQVEKESGSNQYVTDSIALLFKYVFLLARLCGPLTKTELVSLIETGDRTIGSMMDPTVFNHLSDQQLAKRLEAIWKQIKKDLPVEYPLKEVALVCDCFSERLLTEKKVFLVVPNDLNKAGVTESLNELLNQIQIRPQLTVLNLEEFYECNEMCDYVFICGWLGKDKMKQIIFSNVAPNYVPILYDFELPWLRASIDRWNIENSKSNISAFVPEIEEPEESKLSLDYSWFVEPEEPPEEDDFEDLVQKAQKLQWHGYSDFQPGDTAAEGRLVTFSDGSFGVFSRGYSITKIPADEDQSLSSVSVNELYVGDIVIFGGSDHDFLVSESNKLLCKEGHEDSLAIAMSWRDAIHLAKVAGMSDEEIIRRFKKEGIVRTDITFHQWLDDESNVICPRNKEDLIRMSLALGDDTLCDSADDIILHSRIVRAARVSTGKLLMKRLKENIEVGQAIKRLHDLSEFAHQSYVIDVMGVGKVQILSVVEVGQVATYPQRIINQRKAF